MFFGALPTSQVVPPVAYARVGVDRRRRVRRRVRRRHRHCYCHCYCHTRRSTLRHAEIEPRRRGHEAKRPTVSSERRGRSER